MIDFGRIFRFAVDATLRVVTAQVAQFGDDESGDVEQEDEAEVLHPCGFIARPVVTDTLEGVVVQRGDEAVVLVVIDKGAPAQNVEEGEARVHGVGSGNAAAVIRIRNNGDIEITPKSGRNVVHAGGSTPVAKEGSATTGHAHTATFALTAPAGGGAVTGAITIASATDTIASGAGSARVQVP